MKTAPTKTKRKHAVNEVNIKKLIAFIRDQPDDRLMMDRWLSGRFGRSLNQPVKDLLTCNTAYCVGGAAAMLALAVTNPNLSGRAILAGFTKDKNDKSVINSSQIAADFLGLSRMDAGQLFIGAWSTLSAGQQQYIGEITKSQTLRELRHILKTGEV